MTRIEYQPHSKEILIHCENLSQKKISISFICLSSTDIALECGWSPAQKLGAGGSACLVLIEADNVPCNNSKLP